MHWPESTFVLKCRRISYNLIKALLMLNCIFLGVIGDFLRWKAWVPLSRLTLGAYLIHAVVTLRFIYAQMSLVEITQDNMVRSIDNLKRG